ncbi:hypothetical protein D3C75_1013530 [compost metagenome]
MNALSTKNETLLSILVLTKLDKDEIIVIIRENKTCKAKIVSSGFIMFLFVKTSETELIILVVIDN